MVHFLPQTKRQRLEENRKKKKQNFDSEKHISSSDSRSGQASPTNKTACPKLISASKDIGKTSTQISQNLKDIIKRAFRDCSTKSIQNSLLLKKNADKKMFFSMVNDNSGKCKLSVSIGPIDLSQSKAFSSASKQQIHVDNCKEGVIDIRINSIKKEIAQQMNKTETINESSLSSELIEYILDDDGFLCDVNGSRIKDDFGDFVKLEKEHIEYFKSNKAYEEI